MISFCQNDNCNNELDKKMNNTIRNLIDHFKWLLGCKDSNIEQNKRVK